MSTVRNSIEVWIARTQGPERFALLLHVAPDADGAHPGFWQPVTGGVEAGETHHEAAAREIAEETGLKVVAGSLRTVIEDMDVPISPNLTVRKRVFEVDVDQALVRTSPQEHNDHEWCRLEDVAARLWWPSNRTTWDAVRSRLAGR